MPQRLDINDPGFEANFARVLGAKREAAADVDQTVAAIIADVETRGDRAVIDWTARYDHQYLGIADLRIAPAELARARVQCAPEALAALELAARRITDFHERQRPLDLSYTDAHGVTLGYRWTALAAVGLYVPGGSAAYPSSVLMNALPARVAGVPRIVMVVPTPEGRSNPLVLAAAALAGVSEVYRIGGAQAVAALACGTATIAPVDKIVGPGNAYVAAAKRRVFGRVGIDMIAGPSEVLIVADGSNDPDWIAVDLLAQAEHDEAAQSILITDDRAFGDAVAQAVTQQLESLARRDIARASWERQGCIIVVDALDQAVPLIERVAPEHLQLAIADAAAFAARVRHAGAIFLGPLTPEALGDYVAGPNHVLPTSRSARFSSGLGVLDFLKRTTVIGCGAAGLSALGGAAIALAEAEGLDAHARSIAMRLNRPRA